LKLGTEIFELWKFFSNMLIIIKFVGINNFIVITENYISLFVDNL
jgi:hypothetical protein